MHQLHVMLNEKDYARLKEQRQRSGLSTSNLIRSQLAGLEIRERPTEATVELCRELKAIGNNLNQLTWAANRGAPVSDVISRNNLWSYFSRHKEKVCTKISDR